MAWCFSTRASVATVLTTHPCVSRCLRVNVREPGYPGLTRDVSLLRYFASVFCQVIRTHDIDYVRQVGPCPPWKRIATTCVISVWRKDTHCKSMFMLLLKNLACEELPSEHVKSTITKKQNTTKSYACL